MMYHAVALVLINLEDLSLSFLPRLLVLLRPFNLTPSVINLCDVSSYP